MPGKAQWTSCILACGSHGHGDPHGGAGGGDVPRGGGDGGRSGDRSANRYGIGNRQIQWDGSGGKCGIRL